MKVVECGPGDHSYLNDGRRVTCGHPARRCRSEPVEMLGDRKAGMELVVDQGNPIEKKRTYPASGAPTATPQAHAEAGLTLEIGDRAIAQLVPRRRSGESGKGAADADHPVVDQHGHLIGKIFLEAEPDQVAPGEFQELSGPSARRPRGCPPFYRARR